MDKHNKTISLLVLQRLPGTAAGTLQKLYRRFQSLNNIMQTDTLELATLLKPDALNFFKQYRQHGLKSPAGKQAQKDYDLMKRDQYTLVDIESSHYPDSLKEIHYPPPILMVAGNIEALIKEQIAIVGSRKASPSGLENAQRFAADIADNGLTVTSGLALGIDAAAHKGALSVDTEFNRLSTIAVIATGLDITYPARHTQLAQQITQRGAIVSEFPLGSTPRRENFPRRNRIISGLSKGVLVVEAEEKSGSLITARYAMEQNREVFAVPGSINNPASRGCHQLLRDGARLVDCVDDILAELEHPFGQIKMDSVVINTGKANPHNPNTHKSINSKTKPITEPAIKSSNLNPENNSCEPLNSEEKKFMVYLDDNPASIDQLTRRAEQSAAQVSAMLLNLEIKGWVEPEQGGYRRLHVPA